LLRLPTFSAKSFPETFVYAPTGRERFWNPSKEIEI
jgi:hypothetical protein